MDGGWGCHWWGEGPLWGWGSLVVWIHHHHRGSILVVVSDLGVGVSLIVVWDILHGGTMVAAHHSSQGQATHHGGDGSLIMMASPLWWSVPRHGGDGPLMAMVGWPSSWLVSPCHGGSLVVAVGSRRVASWWVLHRDGHSSSCSFWSGVGEKTGDPGGAVGQLWGDRG